MAGWEAKQKLSGLMAIGLNFSKAFEGGNWRKQNGGYK
jgi:hypothetical protein